MPKVSLIIKKGRKASLFFPWLILGPLALWLLPTAASGMCFCGWTLQRGKHLLSQEDSALLSKHLYEWYQTFLKDHEHNLRLSIQAEPIHMCCEQSAWMSDGSCWYLEHSLLSERGYKSSSEYFGAMSFMILWFMCKEHHITQGHLQSPVVPSFKVSLQQLQDWLQATLGNSLTQGLAEQGLGWALFNTLTATRQRGAAEQFSCLGKFMVTEV